jgi:tetratricopeptide (TPR) repeat protein
MRLFQTTLLLFCLLVCSSGYANQAQWEEHMKASSTAYRARDGEKALAEAYKAIKAVADVDNGKNLMTAETLYLLGELNLDLGRLEDALVNARKAYLIRSELLGNEALEVALSANSLAQLYQEVREYEKAIPLNDQAVMIWKRELGADHPHVSVPLNNQGKIFYVLGLYYKQGAEKELDKDLAARMRTESEKLFANSISYFKQAMTILAKHSKEGDANLGACQQNLGDVYYATGDFEQAEDMYRKGLKSLGAALGPTSQHVVKCLTSLASACFKNGKADDAEKYYEAALKYTGQSEIKNNPLHIMELSNKMAAFYESIGKPKKAAACYAQGATIRERLIEAQQGPSK